MQQQESIDVTPVEESTPLLVSASSSSQQELADIDKQIAKESKNLQQVTELSERLTQEQKIYELNRKRINILKEFAQKERKTNQVIPQELQAQMENKKTEIAEKLQKSQQEYQDIETRRTTALVKYAELESMAQTEKSKLDKLMMGGGGWCQNIMGEIDVLKISQGENAKDDLEEAMRKIQDIITKGIKALPNFQALMQSNNIATIDQTIIDYLTDLEYISLTPSEQLLVRETAKTLMLEQLYTLVTIICKPIRERLIPVKVEVEVPVEVPFEVKVPYPVFIPTIPKVVATSLEKLNEMNHIKRRHILNDLQGAVPYQPQPQLQPQHELQGGGGGGKKWKKIEYKAYKNLYLLNKK
jgi:hypothetical protein